MIHINLSGPQGNAFYLLSAAQKFSKQLGYDFDEIQKEMTSSGYENLLEVFHEYFGDYVVFER